MLPRLFVGSLVGTALVAPAVSAALARPGVTPAAALRGLYRVLALVMIGDAGGVGVGQRVLEWVS